MMKVNKLILIGLLFFINPMLWGQAKVDDKPYIEVTGTSEMEVTPDEIFITIVIKERQEGKQKITLEQQEKDLKNVLTGLGINLENLTLSDANADYSRVKWSTKDVVTKNEYVLKVSTAEMVNKVYKKLSEIKVFDAFVSSVSHSKIEEYKKELRIKAIKLAKEKADYLLQAIGYKTGLPLIIKEIMNNIATNAISNQVYHNNGLKSSAYKANHPSIQFKKIKIVTNIYVKFEIKS